MPFRKLPAPIRQHPEALDAWVAHLSERVDNHEERIAEMESRPSSSDTLHHLGHDLMAKQVKTPMGELPLPLAILAGGFLAWKYPETVLKFFGL